ncbi:hypothetical protein LTS18_006071 [Coniosporium uncinatum]|uniref:Uncharacterized protein n=1 Tax=Coniosporium uncinatum TaxID=93489 RepID=A0ACC3D4A2_9PEZI|nr:hypothetical protein LTS18_006071 [Coniosporium uncinatum]
MSRANSPRFSFKNRIGLTLGNEGSTFDDDYDHDLYSIGYDPKSSPVEPDKETAESAAFHDAELERRFHSRPLTRYGWREDDEDPFIDTGAGRRDKEKSSAVRLRKPSTGAPDAFGVHTAERGQDTEALDEDTQPIKDEHQMIPGQFPITPLPRTQSPEHSGVEFPFPHTEPSAPQSGSGYDRTHEFTLLVTDPPSTPNTHAANLQRTLDTQNWLIRELHEQVDGLRMMNDDQQRRMTEQEELVRTLRAIMRNAYKVQREAIDKLEGEQSRLCMGSGKAQGEGEGDEPHRKGGDETIRLRKDARRWFRRLFEKRAPPPSSSPLRVKREEGSESGGSGKSPVRTHTRVLKEVSKMLKKSCGNIEGSVDDIEEFLLNETVGHCTMMPET